MVQPLSENEESIFIEHIETFNGHLKGEIGRVRKADGEKWINDKLAKKASAKAYKKSRGEAVEVSEETPSDS
jgi:hypothetical protein